MSEQWRPEDSLLMPEDIQQALAGLYFIGDVGHAMECWGERGDKCTDECSHHRDVLIQTGVME